MNAATLQPEFCIALQPLRTLSVGKVRSPGAGGGAVGQGGAAGQQAVNPLAWAMGVSEWVWGLSADLGALQERNGAGELGVIPSL